jgi:hypothetical protein
VVNDPWKQTRGHTWNVFKLSQWAFPVFLLMAATGLEVVVRRLRTRRLWYGAALVLPLSLVGVHWEWSGRLGLTMREILPGEAPLATLTVIKQRIQGLPPGTLLVVGRPANANRWLAAYTALLAYPRAVLGDWADSASISNHPVGGLALYESALGRIDRAPYIPLVAGYVPFQPAATEPLGAGYARLRQPSGPLVVHVVNPAGLLLDRGGERAAFRMGEGRTKVVVWTPDTLEAQLQLTLRPYTGRPGTRLLTFLAGGDYSHRSVRLAAAETPVAETRLSGETELAIPLSLPRGLSTVVLVVDEGRGELDAREPVTVVGLRLSHARAATAP